MAPPRWLAWLFLKVLLATCTLLVVDIAPPMVDEFPVKLVRVNPTVPPSVFRTAPPPDPVEWLSVKLALVMFTVPPSFWIAPPDEADVLPLKTAPNEDFTTPG
jgi:hypothetical protein